eukprot:CAMPEP_0194483188 /NCGR_PEP_ID=MMETSP0253-20130528/4891_1 /TAXON_ID=2966 /ORGANISM="Noctiluca scintillans" /LENGTH=37 /DNA_ID= /DNA_START= /DNA_END= /DNA_ORIENTATION=
MKLDALLWLAATLDVRGAAGITPASGAGSPDARDVLR